MAEDNGKSLGWDDQIEGDGDFQLIPAGEYGFRVDKLEKKWFKGSEKMCACNQVELTLEILGDDGPMGNVTTNLFLNEKCMGIYSSFFRSIGQKKHGEPCKPDWGKVIGSTGRCKVKVRTFKTREGKELESNDVTFLDPIPAEQATSFNPGGGGAKW